MQGEGAHSHLRSSRLLLEQARCWPGGFWVLCRQASMAELGPTVHRALWQGPCEKGRCLSHTAPCPQPPTSLSWESRPAASLAPQNTRHSQQTPRSSSSDRLE